MSGFSNLLLSVIIKGVFVRLRSYIDYLNYGLVGQILQNRYDFLILLKVHFYC